MITEQLVRTTMDKYHVDEATARKICEDHAKPAPKLTFKVSEKGAVSVYGLGRFPVTLYGSQWVSLLATAKGLMEFIEGNADALAVKS